MKLLEIVKTVKIDFSQCLIEPDIGSNLDYKLDITPNDFLNYSKKDYCSNDTRGNINALTNAKRAIDCQTDKIFKILGLDPNNFSSIVEEYINKSKHSPIKKDLPIRLKFIQALNFAPAGIISKARLLRNKLEHYYKSPTNEEVSDAIELAELFINATDNRLNNLWDFCITDDEKYSKRAENEIYMRDCISISFNDDKHIFEVVGYFGKNNHLKLSINNSEIEFYFLFKLATSFDRNEEIQDSLIDLLNIIGHPIPSKNIKTQIV
jgi:hypothetical protein